MDDHVKVFFQLEPDEDGWPPVSVESVWAKPSACEGECVIANVPFFTRDATIGDTVQIRKDDDGVRWFVKVVKHSGNSLIRIIVPNVGSIEEVNSRLVSLGCETELAQTHKLLACSVPPSVKLPDVQAYLETQEQAGLLGYEEAILWD